MTKEIARSIRRNGNRVVLIGTRRWTGVRGRHYSEECELVGQVVSEGASTLLFDDETHGVLSLNYLDILKWEVA